MRMGENAKCLNLNIPYSNMPLCCFRKRGGGGHMLGEAS